MVAGFCLVFLSGTVFAVSDQSILYHVVNPGQVVACTKNGVKTSCPSDISDLTDMKGLYYHQNGSFQLVPSANAKTDNHVIVKKILLDEESFQSMLTFKYDHKCWNYEGEGTYNAQDDSIKMDMNLKVSYTSTINKGTSIMNKGEVKVKGIVFTKS